MSKFKVGDKVNWTVDTFHTYVVQRVGADKWHAGYIYYDLECPSTGQGPFGAYENELTAHMSSISSPLFNVGDYVQFTAHGAIWKVKGYINTNIVELEDLHTAAVSSTDDSFLIIAPQAEVTAALIAIAGASHTQSNAAQQYIRVYGAPIQAPAETHNPPSCECGVHKAMDIVEGPAHSHWCPAYKAY